MSLKRMIGCGLLVFLLVTGILLVILKKKEREGKTAEYWMLAGTCLVFEILQIRLIWIWFTH